MTTPIVTPATSCTPNDELKTSVAHRFGKAAAHYDSNAHIQQRILDWSLRIDLPSYSQVMDLGCGTGRALTQLAGRHQHCVAVDIAQPMLNMAQDKHRQFHNISYHCADFDALAHAQPQISAPIDCVFSSMALQWSSDPLSALQSIADVLAPNGRALLTILVSPSFGTLRQAWSQIGRATAVNQFCSVSQWQQAASQAGFSGNYHIEVFVDAFADFSSMLHSIKDVGASSSSANTRSSNKPASTILTKSDFAHAQQVFLALNGGQFSLDYHVVQCDLTRLAK